MRGGIALWRDENDQVNFHVCQCNNIAKSILRLRAYFVKIILRLAFYVYTFF